MMTMVWDEDGDMFMIWVKCLGVVVLFRLVVAVGFLRTIGRFGRR